jgi:hypothetical protein
MSYVGALFIVFGLSMVLLPTLTLQVFSLILYSDTQYLAQLAGNALSYLKLIHAVLGAVIAGWGALLIGVTRMSQTNDASLARKALAISLLVWFVPDTGYSLIGGFWQNAIFNLAFAMPFAWALWRMRKA